MAAAADRKELRDAGRDDAADASRFFSRIGYLVLAVGAPVGVVPDGRHGLWIPTFVASGGPVHMVHYSDGHLRNAQMPVGARRLGLLGIAAVGQTKTSFAVGSIFKRSMPSVDQTADVFEFRR